MNPLTSSNNFELAPSLKQETFYILSLPLCEILLQNDARYPWVILVPRIIEIKEFYELPPKFQQILMDEMVKVSKSLKIYTKADKINIAAFGNMTPQLHIHIIARFTTDPLWPHSVIGTNGKVPYTQEQKNILINDFQKAFK